LSEYGGFLKRSAYRSRPKALCRYETIFAKETKGITLTVEENS